MTTATATDTMIAEAPREPARGGYPATAIILHWMSAVLVLALFVSGVLMKQFSDGPQADALYTFHKTAGFSLFCLVLVRMAARIVLMASGRWRRGAGMRWVHGVLYLGLVAVPLLGWAGVSDFGARTIYFGWSLPQIWPEGAGFSGVLLASHGWLAFGLLALVIVHIGLALGDYVHRGAAGLAEAGDAAEAATSLSRPPVP